MRKSQRDKEKPCIESQPKQYLWILYRNKFCLSFTGADVIAKTRERKLFLTYVLAVEYAELYESFYTNF